MNFVFKAYIQSHLHQRTDLNLLIFSPLFGEVHSSPVSMVGLSPCKNVVRLLRYVCKVQHHLLLNRRSKTSPSQFSCCQSDGTRGLGLWGRSARTARTRCWRRVRGGGREPSPCSGRNLPLLMSKDQLTETVTETHCTNSSWNRLCQI